MEHSLKYPTPVRANPGYTLKMKIAPVLALALSIPLSLAGQTSETENPPSVEAPEPEVQAFPVHETLHYKVKYLGLTCGHLYLTSTLEDLDGKPAYHFVVTANNSKFFNKIYKIDTRIDSWVDAQSLSTVLYETVSTEKGETSEERHEVDFESGTVRSVKNGKEKILEFSSEDPVLDPLAFVLGLQAQARKGGDKIELTLLTAKGATKTIATVQGPKKKRTSRGKRQLLEIEPKPADGKMFSKKGQFSMWVDPEGTSTLFILDFNLSFGHLTAKID